MLLVAAASTRAWAGSYIAYISDSAGVRDTHLRQDSDSHPYGTSQELRVKVQTGKMRNALVQFPLTALQNRTILQAWLSLRQYDMSDKASPIDARVYPLTESWYEPQATWDVRDLGLPWTRPGGTRGSYWSGRALLSSSTNNTKVTWQVGPILRAWQAGDLPNNGFIIEPVPTGLTREAAFRSREYSADPSQRPSLVVYYTDEPPAVQNGWAEIQPREIPVRSQDASFTLWLDVDASRMTPTGTPTGFDVVTMVHNGALAITGFDGISTSGPTVTGPIPWYDNGATFSVYLPKVTGKQRFGIRFRANVLSTATGTQVELPVFVDDSSTPGVWPQILWPGNADGLAGNGDSWNLLIKGSQPVSIDLKPDTATVLSTECTPFELTGVDSTGTRFALIPDSLVVRPPGGGSFDEVGQFCAAEAGPTTLIAYYGGLADTSRVTVMPALYPQVSRLQLLGRQGLPANALAPLDTMFVEADLSDQDGFKDITRLDFQLAYRGHESDTDAPAFHAAFRWTRGSGGGWTQLDPAGSSWQLLKGWCSLDSTTNSTSPQTVRLALVPGAIARASSDGGWSLSLRITSLTPADVRDTTRTGIDALPYLRVTSLDPKGAFAPGEAGATHLPLGTPADGRLQLQVVANLGYSLQAALENMAGAEAPSETLRVGPPEKVVAWALASSGANGDTLGTNYSNLGPAQPAPETEVPAAVDLFLWTSLAPTLSPQLYQGNLDLRAGSTASAQWSPVTAVPLDASVAGNGLAAQSAKGEVVPHLVEAGAANQTISAFLLPTFRLADTGIDRVLVSVPEGYGSPHVTSVRVAGLPASFTDLSQNRLAAAALAIPLNTTKLVEVDFELSTPATVDTAGADFVVLFDDSRTTLGAQTALEGDADGIADGDNWHVTVVPGPPARMEIAPDSATCFVDSTVAFSASTWDANGNPVAIVPSWAVVGGVGTIDPYTGRFTGANPGSGLVIAKGPNVHDTAAVAVRPFRGIAVRSVHGPAAAYQGEGDLGAQVLVENTGVVPMILDTLELVFRRSSGNANSDFVVIPLSGNQSALGGGESARFNFEVQVLPDAATGPLEVDAHAAARDTSGGLIIDDRADTTLALNVAAGGITVQAFQDPATAHPGSNLGNVFQLVIDNLYPEPRTLRTLTLDNATVGPGGQAQLDSEWGELSLFRIDDTGLPNAMDSLLAQVRADQGEVAFQSLDLGLPAAGELRLAVRATVPIAVRDGDRLDLAIGSGAGMTFDRPVIFRNAWPLAPSAAYTVDGMVAAQLSLDPVGSRNFMAGSRDNLALDVVLPANGYEADRLDRFGVVNTGTALAAGDIDRVDLWVDDGDGQFDPSADRRARTLSFTGSRWEATGVAETIPVGGARVFVTVDLNPLATDGRTVRLALPSGPDFGVGMASGDDGPLDRAVQNPRAQSISTVDRVTFNAVPVAPGSVAPGQREVVLGHLVATNTYATPRTLIGVVLHDAGVSAGTPAQLDREIATLELRPDGDDDGSLGDASVDPVVGSSFFSGGKAAFTGFQWVLAPGQSRHLFVTADVSLTDAADQDTLAAAVAGAADFEFAEPTAVAASYPLESGARMAVDGMVAAQITNVGTPGITLGHDDGPVPALDMIVPANGYAGDVLNSVQVVNVGDAGVRDIAELRLWRDGGDGVFSAGAGDDRDLGPLTWAGGSWQSGALAEALGGAGARLFVGLKVSATLAESTTVKLAIPVGGIAVASSNDGPRDLPVQNSQSLLISSSPLLATLELAPAATTVGGLVTLRMIVRNAGTETVLGITPADPAVSGDGAVLLAGGPAPSSLDLDPAAADTFTWTYQASAAGEVQFAASAEGTGQTSGLPRRSLTSASAVERIYTQLSQLELSPLQSMPVAISQGQAGVVPFSLTLSNNGGSSASDARLLGLRVRLEGETGAGIVPSRLLTRVAVNEGTNVYLVKTALESSGAVIDLPLATPVVVRRLEPVTLSLRLDVSDTTTVSSFRVVISDSSEFTVQDATSGAPVAVKLASGSFPLRSGLASIVAIATRLDVQNLPAADRRVSRGAQDVPLLGIHLNNPGAGSVTSTVRLRGFGVTVTDSAGAPLAAPAAVLQQIALWNGTQRLASGSFATGGGASLNWTLNPPLAIAVNAPVDLSLTGDVGAAATLGSFKLRLRSAASFIATDANTGDTVTVFFASDPIAGPLVRVEAAAETLRVSGTSMLPPMVLVGQPDVVTLDAVLRHPGAPGTARIRIDSVTVHLRDDAGHPLTPSSIVSRARLLAGPLELGSITGLPGAGESFALPLTMPPLLDPGDSLQARLLIDVSPAAPATFFELTIPGSGVVAVDANSGQAVHAEGRNPLDLPLLSGLGRLASPARELSVELQSRMPAVWAADGRPLSVGVFSLVNTAADGSGSIYLGRLAVAGADRRFAPVAVGAAAVKVQAYVNGTLWAESPDLTPDSTVARLSGDTLQVAPGTPVGIELRIVPRVGSAVSSFRIGLDQAGVGVVQPVGALLAVNVRAAAGAAFPLWSEAGGASPQTLKDSYSNFPNPFAAGREATTFVYYLPSEARVTLRVWTARGEPVATVIDGALRPAGLNQSERWDGRNGRGDAVLNGVYVAELTARFTAGGSERVLRKLAVVR